MSEILLIITIAMACLAIVLLAVWVLSEMRTSPADRLFRAGARHNVELQTSAIERGAHLGSRVDEVVRAFQSGCPCSRVLLQVYGPELGLTCGEALEAGFRFARELDAAENCGAVTGALTILSQRYPGANASSPEGRMVARSAMGEFARRFQARHGTLICRQLLRQKEGRRAGQRLPLDYQSAGWLKVCPELMRDAARIVEDMVPPDGRLQKSETTRLAA